jgi:TRAP-type C4-dicarboxylate transport system permease small subunit
MHDADPDLRRPSPLRALERVETAVAVSLFVLLVVTVGLQVVTRYVFNNSFGWTEEIARYLLVGVTFLGGGIAVRRRAHLSLELWSGASPRVQAIHARAVDLMTAAFYGWAAVLAFDISSALARQRMTVIDVPISVLYYIVCAGFGLMAFWALVSAARASREGLPAP